MHNSDKILEHIKINFPNTNTIYGILIPNINILNIDILKKNNAFSLLCTIDGIYSYKNFNKAAKENTLVYIYIVVIFGGQKVRII
jgi:hypothetical protein